MASSPAPLRVGVQLPTRERAIVGDLAVGPLLAFARRAKALGFDSLWTGDSLTARPRLEPVVVLSAVAAVTERVTLGTAEPRPAVRRSGWPRPTPPGYCAASPPTTTAGSPSCPILRRTAMRGNASGRWPRTTAGNRTR